MPWSLGDLLRGIGSGVVLCLIPLSVIAGIDLEARVGPIGALAVISLILYGSFGLPVWFFAVKRYGLSLRRAGFETIPAGVLLLIPLVALGALVLNGFVTILMRNVVGDVPDVRDQVLPAGVEGLGPTDLLLLLLVAAVAAPLVEEFVFRGLLYPLLRSRWGVVPSAVVSALVFGFAHLSLRLVPSLFVLGLILAWLTERYRSIWPAVGVHVLNNAFALAVLYALVEG